MARVKINTTGNSLASFKVWVDNHIYAIHLLISVQCSSMVEEENQLDKYTSSSTVEEENQLDKIYQAAEKAFEQLEEEKEDKERDYISEWYRWVELTKKNLKNKLN